MFWSFDTGSYCPHAFIRLKGEFDSPGEALDTSSGFTVYDNTPVTPVASLPSHIDHTNKTYMQVSNAHFRVTVTDIQYAAIDAQAA